MLTASTAAVGETRPPPDPGAVFWCVAETLRVDGIAVVQHAWCTMAADGRLVLLDYDDRVFGLRPAKEARPPIPKHQERLE